MNTPTLILGAGVAGIAAARYYADHGQSYLVLEERDHVGGHASSVNRDGFIFDEGPHISFTKREHIRSMLASAVDDRYVSGQAVAWNFWRGTWVKHPVQVHLGALPEQIAVPVARDLLAAAALPLPTSNNYADWCRSAFGAALFDEFITPYTEKYWTVAPSELTTDWVSGRILRPDIDDVLRGLMGVPAKNGHYITDFRYPINGGFSSYANGMSRTLNIRTQSKVIAVDISQSKVTTQDGEQYSYKHLLSSLPLPALISLIPDAPTSIRECAQQLKCTSALLIDICLKRSEGFPGGDWFYVYDSDLLPVRVHYPHRFSRGNVPAGYGSIQVEIYHSSSRRLPSDDIQARVLQDLQAMGVTEKGDEILNVSMRNIQYANVIFDHQRASAVIALRSWLDQNGIAVCGRYGCWDYFWTDDSIDSGLNAAKAMCSGVAGAGLQ